MARCLVITWQWVAVPGSRSRARHSEERGSIMSATPLTDIHGSFRNKIEEWAIKTLTPQLLRLAGEETLAGKLEIADGESLWRTHFYGLTAVEDLARKLPGFGRLPEGVVDRYGDLLAAVRRLPEESPHWLATLACGLRYHPELEAVLAEVHAFADTVYGSTPDWRVTVPPEADFATPPSSAQIGRLPVWLRATGSYRSCLVWRVYADQACRRYLGDLVTNTSAGLRPFQLDRTSRQTLLGGNTGVVVRGRLCQVHRGNYLIVE